MINVFGINQRFKNRTRSSSIPPYSNSPSPQVETQAYAGQRSRLVDQPLAEAEGFVAAQAREVAL
ncbi:MAG: hypothetical protein WBG32_04210 [Nodosilinea sp.]